MALQIGNLGLQTYTTNKWSCLGYIGKSTTSCRGMTIRVLRIPMSQPVYWWFNLIPAHVFTIPRSVMFAELPGPCVLNKNCLFPSQQQNIWTSIRIRYLTCNILQCIISFISKRTRIPPPTPPLPLKKHTTKKAIKKHIYRPSKVLATKIFCRKLSSGLCCGNWRRVHGYLHGIWRSHVPRYHGGSPGWLHRGTRNRIQWL